MIACKLSGLPAIIADWRGSSGFMRIGILGASRIAPNAIIAPAAAFADVTLSVIAARDLDRAEAYAQTHGIARAVAGYDALLEAPDVDCVYCALPPPFHLGIARRALAAGKMLLIEKPFASDAAAARAIAGASAAAGHAALEAFHYRFHPQFEQALAIVGSGQLGTLTALTGHFDALIPQRPGEMRYDRELGGGATMDLGCYVIHALRLLTGAEPTVTTLTAQMVAGVDLAVRARLDFGGVPAEVRWSMTAPRDDGLSLTGTKGTLRIDGFVSPHRGATMTLTTASGTRTFAADTTVTTYQAQLAHALAVWRGECPPLTGGADAIATMTAIDACRAAADAC